MEDWPNTLQNDPMRAYRAKRDSSRKSVQSKYTFLGFISSGTYGRVYKVQAKDGEDANRVYAAKKFKPDKEGEAVTYTGISQSAIREIALNREIDHENITALKEVILEDKSIYMIFEYAEHDFLQVIHHHSQNLRTQISEPVLKSLIYQLLNGVLYLHSSHILHRDLKPANILITSNGVVKIGDLGLARLVHEPLQPLISGDKVVVTIWYRAPELLLGAKHYTKAIDIWAVGCVLAELASLRPIFKGEEAKMDSKKNVPFQRDQLLRIFEVRGTPDVTEWPALKYMPEFQNMKRLDKFKDRLYEWCQTRIRSKDGYDLLRRLFAYDPDKRLAAREAMEHKWFQEEPIPTRNAFLTLSGAQLPPQRRITHDEASAAMLPTNAAAAAARAPPPAPASSARPPSGVPSFTSGFGPGAPAAAGSGSYATGTGYGGVNMARLPIGVSSGNAGSDTVAGNTRKKARLG
ncbi:kinase-like protein [Fomitiporia mediterranea MF3/22]|uniref:kinase-like protein n=1 Tax=Fomitiporia mediterranea (strain MF3/22) TaxID=694068 RepID=UPI0004408AFF|nr:kinase-like protein [Fomitiporia mediterranea MF3/22]EJD01713.1 kinase-like protein [Fomitiporia mediterranea MF3/22]